MPWGKFFFSSEKFMRKMQKVFHVFVVSFLSIPQCDITLYGGIQDPMHAGSCYGILSQYSGWITLIFVTLEGSNIVSCFIS